MNNITLCAKAGFLSILLFGNSLSASAEGLTGTFYLKAAEFHEGAASNHGNVYRDGVDIVIARETNPDTGWDLTVTNLCGQGTTYGGTLSDNDSTLTLSMLGYHYFSERDYAEKGTESLGAADSTIMGSLVIDLQADGSLHFSDFTAISTVIAGAPTSTALATYKGAVAVPVTSYHFKAATYTPGAASAYGNVYPAEFDFTLRRCIENDNYDVAITNLCNQGTTYYATANGDNTELTINNVAYAYFSVVDYSGVGTESLGAADGTMMGSITMTLQADGSWAFSDFTVIRTILPPSFTVLATYAGGVGTPSTASAIAPVQTDDAFRLFSRDGSIIASRGDVFLAAFDLSGRPVASGLGTVRGLTPGLYIVRSADGRATKVVVR